MGFGQFAGEKRAGPNKETLANVTPQICRVCGVIGISFRQPVTKCDINSLA